MGNDGAHDIEVSVHGRSSRDFLQHGVSDFSGIGALHVRQYRIITQGRFDMSHDAVGLLLVPLLRFLRRIGLGEPDLQIEPFGIL
ncbi:hypothetical protein EOB49_34290 [Mesorhizobium sp. M7A.F.Ca.MR.148.00.0.0]|nr:hypothetical protein EOB49_34290 [Mesorhizobium sp. M7A.F.Ca.MR.148.00.0.0]